MNKLPYVRDVGIAAQRGDWTFSKSRNAACVSRKGAGLVSSPNTASNVLCDFKSALCSLKKI